MHVHDAERTGRIGMPEAVLCEPKSAAQLDQIIAAIDTPTLLTRLAPDQLSALAEASQALVSYHEPSHTAVLNGALAGREVGRVAVVAAGTSDHRVAAEAEQTLRFQGVAVDLIVDVGVAGLWRLERRLEEIRRADVVVAVAGMDAAMVTVLGGLIAAPLIAVPTSVGYGVAADGSAALNSSLASCAQGVTVVNVDNGFGGACAAIRILNAIGDRSAASLEGRADRTESDAQHCAR